MVMKLSSAQLIVIILMLSCSGPAGPGNAFREVDGKIIFEAEDFQVANGFTKVEYPEASGDYAIIPDTVAGGYAEYLIEVITPGI
jgi:hypothetical protein